MFVALLTDRTTVSVAAIAVFGTVNEAQVAEPAAVNMVIVPLVLLPVVGVGVVRLVNWVTATPAPVEYPTPPAPDDSTLVVAVTVVKAPVLAAVEPIAGGDAR